jgi:hypothetical protein
MPAALSINKDIRSARSFWKRGITYAVCRQRWTSLASGVVVTDTWRASRGSVYSRTCDTDQPDGFYPPGGNPAGSQRIITVTYCAAGDAE